MLQITKHDFSVPELEREINSSLDAAKARAVNDAMHLASQNLPANQTEVHSMYWQEHHSRFDTILSFIKQTLKRDASVFGAQQANQTTNEDLQKLQNDTKFLKDKLADHLVQLPPAPVKKDKFKGLVPAISALEGAYSVPVFESMGFSPVLAWIMGAVFGICLWLFFKLIKKAFTKAPTLWVKLLICAGTVLILGVVFTTMCKMRAEHLTAIAQSEGLDINYSPWPILIISLFFSVIALLVTLFAEPSDKEKESMEIHSAWQTSKNQLESEIARKEDSMKRLRQTSIQGATQVAERLEYGHSLELRVTETARLAFEQFKKQNLAHRTDGPGTLSIAEPYPFQFNYNFAYKNQPS